MPQAGQRAEPASGLKWHLASRSHTASPTSADTHTVTPKPGPTPTISDHLPEASSHKVHEPWGPRQTRGRKGSPKPGVPDVNQGKAHVPLASPAPQSSPPTRASRAMRGRSADGRARGHSLRGRSLHSTAPSGRAGGGLVATAWAQSHLTGPGRRKPA